jgi:RND family efflux transporter MFP subunit
LPSDEGFRTAGGTQVKRCTKPWWLVAILLGCVLAAGCGHTPAEPTAPEPPEVPVARALTRVVSDYEDFTGRTAAVDDVDVRARVTGYLSKVLVKDGAMVKAGDPLFVIDPRPYQAEVNRAAANLEQIKARLARLDQDLARGRTLLKTRAMSREQYDKIAGDRAEANASVGVARASLETAKLNLAFTRVTAPISGRISRKRIDPGNMVKADETVLTNIVTLDPVHVYFDVDERTLLRMRKTAGTAEVLTTQEASLPVLIGLADEEGFSWRATVNFEDNKVDPQTGTLRVRAVSGNPSLLLSAGLFARVRVPVGTSYVATLVSERALGTDQGQKYVYVLNDNDEVVYRRVEAGTLHDGLRAIKEGLRPGERVVVSGLQRVKPGSKVQPRLVEMPGAGPSPAKRLITRQKSLPRRAGSS